MRWIFLCLVSFNVVYFAWQQWLAFESVGTDETKASSVEKLNEEVNLVLLKEGGSNSGKVENGIQAMEVAPLVRGGVDHIQHKQEALCHQIGPYLEKSKADLLVQRLLGEGFLVGVHAVEASKAQESWVLIPSLKNRKASMDLLRELQAKKIDSYLVAEGEHKNAISLGLFQKSASAIGVQEKMKAAGYISRIEVIEKAVSEFWVQVNMKNESVKQNEKLESIALEEKNVSFSKSLCETFAHPK